MTSTLHDEAQDDDTPRSRLSEQVVNSLWLIAGVQIVLWCINGCFASST